MAARRRQQHAQTEENGRTKNRIQSPAKSKTSQDGRGDSVSSESQGGARQGRMSLPYMLLLVGLGELVEFHFHFAFRSTVLWLMPTGYFRGPI